MFYAILLNTVISKFNALSPELLQHWTKISIVVVAVVKINYNFWETKNHNLKNNKNKKQNIFLDTDWKNIVSDKINNK